MGAQSTINISRKRAEEMWIEQKLDEAKLNLQLMVQGYDDTGLEIQVENDFHNYNIVG